VPSTRRHNSTRVSCLGHSVESVGLFDADALPAEAVGLAPTTGGASQCASSEPSCSPQMNSVSRHFYSASKDVAAFEALSERSTKLTVYERVEVTTSRMMSLHVISTWPNRRNENESRQTKQSLWAAYINVRSGTGIQALNLWLGFTAGVLVAHLQPPWLSERFEKGGTSISVKSRI